MSHERRRRKQVRLLSSQTGRASLDACRAGFFGACRWFPGAGSSGNNGFHGVDLVSILSSGCGKTAQTAYGSLTAKIRVISRLGLFERAKLLLIKAILPRMRGVGMRSAIAARKEATLRTKLGERMLASARRSG
jgi:hypothetical protein